MKSINIFRGPQTAQAVSVLIVALSLTIAVPARAYDGAAMDLVNQAEAAFNNRQYDDAIALCSKARLDDPTYPAALTWMAAAYQHENKYDIAITIYQQVITLAPTGSDADNAREEIKKLRAPEQTWAPAAPAANAPVQNWQFTVNGVHPQPITTVPTAVGLVLSVGDIMQGLQGTLTWDMDGDQAQASCLGKAVDLIPGNDFVFLNAARTPLKTKIVQQGQRLYLTPRDVIALWGIAFKPNEAAHSFDLIVPQLPDPNDADPKAKWVPAVLASPMQLAPGTQVLCAPVSEIAKLANFQYKRIKDRAEITGDNLDVVLSRNSSTVTVNGNPVDFGVATYETDTDFYAPIDPLGTSLGLHVSLDNTIHTARLGGPNFHVLLALPAPHVP